MKNLNWSKMRFICIFLAFSLVILGYFFRNHYYYQFLGLAYICIAISNMCLYLFELKEKGHSEYSTHSEPHRPALRATRSIM